MLVVGRDVGGYHQAVRAVGCSPARFIAERGFEQQGLVVVVQFRHFGQERSPPASRLLTGCSRVGEHPGGVATEFCSSWQVASARRRQPAAGADPPAGRSADRQRRCVGHLQPVPRDWRRTRLLLPLTTAVQVHRRRCVCPPGGRGRTCACVRRAGPAAWVQLAVEPLVSASMRRSTSRRACSLVPCCTE